MKFLLIGDIHARSKTPHARRDNIQEVLADKFSQVGELALKHGVTAVITTGDLFDKARVSNETLLFTSELINKLPVQLITAVGNHDMIGNSNENYKLTSLHILEKITENLRVMNNDYIRFRDLTIFFNRYGNDNFIKKNNKTGFNILVTHSMITESATMFDSISVQDVKTNYDFILTGHNHSKFLYKNIYNPGALLRLTAGKEDRKRIIEVGLISIEKEIKLERILLKINPEEEVFDLEQIIKKEKILDAAMIDKLNSVISKISTVQDVFNLVLKNKDYNKDALELLKKYVDI